MNRFDFIIVGAGSSGCVLANRLSADPGKSVLLLEAGGTDRHPLIRMPLAWTRAAMAPRFTWGHVSEPEPWADNRQIPHPRGKLLGGCSSINGMMYSRGNAGDYDRWHAMGLPGWSYAEVLPYFKRSEASWRGETAYHGASGPLTTSRHSADPAIHHALLRTAQTLGFQSLDDFNGVRCEGFGLPDFNSRKGHRVSTATGFLQPATRRPNLTVRTGARAHRVLLAGGRATGVEYWEGGSLHTVHADAEVILSGGSLHSPHLLLLSGIGAADELRTAGVTPLHDLPGVGKNLQDHPMVGSMYELARPIGFDSQLRVDRMAMAVARWFLSGSGPIGTQPFVLQGFLRTAAELDWPDAQLQVVSVSMMARPWFPGWRRGVGHSLSAGALHLRPECRGSVTLRSADPKDLPRIVFNLLQTDNDRRAARTLIRLIREVFAIHPAAGLVKAEAFPGSGVCSDADIDAYVRATITTGLHPTSSCAMGMGREAVVDAALRVRGIEGLRVVDCSVMPDIVSGNTGAPAIMIAEKAADMILGRDPLPAAQLPARVAA